MVVFLLHKYREGEKLTEKELSQYRAIKDEIELLSRKINSYDKKEDLVTDKVKGSSRDYPYIEQNYTITGIDVRNTRKLARLRRKREIKRDELIDKEAEIYDFIYSIPDSQLRQIFILRFIDGLEYNLIGRKLHLDRTTVAKKIKKYLEEES